MELKIIKQVEPLVNFNKEELKEQLSAELKKYSNLVITVDSEADGKKARAELNKLRTEIENSRKDIKKKMSKPIEEFESDCKELVGLVDEVIQPIDKQLKELKEQQEKEKEAKVKAMIFDVVAEYELDKKHAQQLTLDSSYLNKTATENKILTDLRNRAEALRIAQNTVTKNRKLIIDACSIYEQLKVNSQPHLDLLDAGQDVTEIISKIHDYANKIQDEERQKKEREFKEQQEKERAEFEQKLKAQQEAIQERINEPEPEVHAEIAFQKEAREDYVIEATLKVSATEAQLSHLKQFMEQSGIRYKEELSFF